MSFITQFVTLVILIAIAYMDFRFRYVQLYLFIVLFFLNMVNAVMVNDFSSVMIQSAINSGLLMLMIAVLWLYYSIKGKGMEGFINRKLGSGDIVFWLAISPLFSLINFLLFLITSLLLVLFVSMVRLLLSRKTDLIPLAGWQSLMLSFLIIPELFVSRYHFPADWLSLPL